MLNQPTGYLIPELEGQTRPDGSRTVFARRAVQAGELLAVWGGEIVSGEQLQGVPADAVHLGVQVEENLYLISTYDGPADWINHSCEPNAGLSGQIALVAMRDIEPGEEICFDYAMSDGSPYDQFECECGAPACRGYISGNDWRNPDLWARYEGYFSPYLQRRIERLRREDRVKSNGRRRASELSAQPVFSG